MKVLVTGASGFLGSHVAEALVEAGHGVRAVVRRTSKVTELTRLGVELAYASIETGDGLDDAMRDVDAVVHGAAIVKARSAAEFEHVNVGGTRQLLDAARRRGGLRRFVYVSSLAAHGFGEDGAPRPLDAVSKPVTHYGRSKLAGERLVLAAKDELPVSVLRPPAIYGPRDVEMFAFFQMIARRLMPFMGAPTNLLSLVYASDCARAVRLLLERDHPSGRVYFVDDGRTYTQLEFGAIIERTLGTRAIRLPLPIGVVHAAATVSEAYGRVRGQAMMLTRDKVNELREPYLIGCGRALRDELGYTPEVQLEEGARRTVEWYRAQGWL